MIFFPGPPETHTKRQATQHGCLSKLGDGDKGIEIVYDEFLPGRLEQPRQNKNLLYRQDKPNKPTKEGHLLFVVLFESPFPVVSTVSRGHPSIVSLPPSPQIFSQPRVSNVQKSSTFISQLPAWHISDWHQLPPPLPLSKHRLFWDGNRPFLWSEPAPCRDPVECINSLLELISRISQNGTDEFYSSGRPGWLVPVRMSLIILFLI